MPLLISQEEAAKGILIATVIGAAAGEVAAGYLGQTRSLGESARATLFFESRGGDETDRGTKRIVLVGALIAIGAAIAIANVTPLRAGANTWATFALGIALAWAGALLRIWAVRSLGRFFERNVVIQEGHVVHRDGPYRWLRHPAYAGSLITFFGLGLAIGSWLGALVCVAIVFVAYIPRIRVEEAELTRALGASYADYARGTARLLPGVW